MRKTTHEDLLGLSTGEARRKLLKEGYNELTTAKPKNLLFIFLNVIKEPMLLLLVACSSIYFILGDPHEAVLLLLSVVGVAGISLYQERKTERSLEALKNLASPTAMVIRDGMQMRIQSREVVMGDIIVLSEGDRVPADAIVLEAVNLSADESLLTGESVAVTKSDYDGKAAVKKPGGDNQYYAYSGTMVVKGHCMARVIATAEKTEMGKIGKALDSLSIEKTLLQVEVRRIVIDVAIIGFILCCLLVIVYGLTRGDWLRGLLAGLTMAMSAMPEEFPIALTIFLSVGAWRLAQKQVLTRRSATIETLGSATVLCVDKTGTLTENKMTLASIYSAGKRFAYHPALSEAGVKRLVKYGVLASQKEPFDPMEIAFINAGRDIFEHEKNIHEDMEIVKEYGLEKYSLSVAHVWHNGKDKFMIAAKGAPEAIIDLCHISDVQKEKLMNEVQLMALEGFRVLAVAKGQNTTHRLPKNRHDIDFEFLGLVGLADPVRPGINKAVKECRLAGIRVVMITGDYPTTAQNIAGQIGILSPGGIITGSEMDKMSPEALKERVGNVNIFCRVAPEQKLSIVTALKRSGEVVAMTGDGVNDAPALKAAHIGIAMGKRGTDVAREAAGIVLLDDNFASIVSGIRLGRRIYNNLQKALVYILAIHVPVAGLSLLPVFLGWPLILLPAHIVFLELLFDPICTIVFENEKEEANIMHRKPRKIDAPVFGRKMVTISLLQGLTALIITLITFKLCQDFGFSVNKSRALTFLVLISANLALVFTNRSWIQSSLNRLRQSLNLALLIIMTIAVLIIITIMNSSYLLDVFKFERVAIQDALYAVIAGVFVILWFEIIKKTKLLKN